MIIGQIFFSLRVGRRVFGWSEDHVMMTAATLPTALNDLWTLAIARSNLLGAGASIDYLRVSDDTIVGDSQVGPGLPWLVLLVPQAGGGLITQPNPGAPNPPLEFPPLLNPGSTSNPPNQGQSFDGFYFTALPAGVPAGNMLDLIADQEEVGYLIRLEAGTTFTARRSLLLRGLPDGVTLTTVDNPGAVGNSASANWVKAYNNWKTVMLSGKYGMKFLNKTAQNNPQPITNWAVAIVQPNLAWTVTATIPTLGALVGDKVRISKVTLQGPGGTLIRFGELVSVDVSSNITQGQYVFRGSKEGSIFYNSPVLGAASIVSKGFARRQVYLYGAYNNLVPRRWGERKTGRPFDPPRGRVKSKK